MKNDSLKFKIILILSGGFTLLVFSSALGAAKSPEPSVDLLWEAETYTPASYRGRALPSPGSLVKVVAAAEIYDARGERIKDQDLNFQWRKDGAYLPGISGPGKNSLSYRTETALGRENTIEVAVSPQRRTSGASKIEPTRALIKIPVVRPRILFYPADELKLSAINYQQTLEQLELYSPSARIAAEPFYFSLPAWLNRRLRFEWRSGNELIEPATDDPRFLTVLSPLAEVSGERTVSLRITNLDRLLQNASGRLSIRFGRNEPADFGPSF